MCEDQTRIPPEDRGFAWLIADLETGEYHMRRDEVEAFNLAQILGKEPFRENVRCPTPSIRLFGTPDTLVVMTLEPIERAEEFVYGKPS